MLTYDVAERPKQRNMLFSVSDFFFDYSKLPSKFLSNFNSNKQTKKGDETKQTKKGDERKGN